MYKGEMQSVEKMQGEEHDVLVRQWIWWGVAEVVAGLCKGFKGGLKVWRETDENTDGISTPPVVSYSIR